MPQHEQLHATPNINGNTPGSMVSAMLDVTGATRELRAKLTTLRSDYVHGRNYQTVEHKRTAQDVDKVTLSRIEQAVLDIEAWAMAEAVRVHRIGKERE